MIRGTYTAAADPQGVVIGFTAEDLRIEARPDWGWAFGWRDGSLAVLSSSRMQPRLPVPGGLEATRLRKMTTKYIGVLYFGLSESGDPRSVLYGRILGVSDLDAMGEDY